MAQLFKTAACFTDIHYGLKQNSRLHLDDCRRYIEWFIAEAKARDAETCIFLGDWMHHRASVNVATMNATIKDLSANPWWLKWVSVSMLAVVGGSIAAASSYLM